MLLKHFTFIIYLETGSTLVLDRILCVDQAGIELEVYLPLIKAQTLFFYPFFSKTGFLWVALAVLELAL